MSSQALSQLKRQQVLHATVWLGLAALLISRLSWNVVDLDIWHEMALIRASLAAHRLITTDLFSYGPTLGLVVDHEWGAGAVAYFLATFFGAAGILIFKYIIGCSIALFAAWCAMARGASLAAFSLLAPVGILFVGIAFSPIRGHMYSLWFAALLLCLLERDRRGDRRWILLWLLLFPLWVNLHGGFVVGIGFAAVYCFEQAVTGKPYRHLVGVVAAMALLVAFNPFGFNYYSYLWRALRMARPAIGEWGPIWGGFPSLNLIVFLISLAVVAYAVVSLRSRVIPGIGLILVSAAEGALHQRMLPFYALVFTCYAPAYLDRTPLGARLRAGFRNYTLFYQAVWTGVVIFFVSMAVSLAPWQLRVPGNGKQGEMIYPAGAVDYLRRIHFQGNVMTPFECGAYVFWRIYPSVRVSVDSRYEVAYPTWWVDETFRFYKAMPGWESTLERYPAALVLVSKIAPVASVIGAQGWQRVYTDGAFEIYARHGLDLPVVDYGGRTFDGRFP